MSTTDAEEVKRLGAMAAVGAGIAGVWGAVGAFLGRRFNRMEGQPAAPDATGEVVATKA